jgi:hypothetical protein
LSTLFFFTKKKVPATQRSKIPSLLKINQSAETPSFPGIGVAGSLKLNMKKIWVKQIYS